MLAACALALSASIAGAQRIERLSDGSVAPGASRAPADASRLSTLAPELHPDLKARVQVACDSAQRIALSDFDWKGRVRHVGIAEEDARVFWDVRIVPDSARAAEIRYRVDAASGGILSINELPSPSRTRRSPAAARPRRTRE